MSVVELLVDGEIAHIHLNRPERLNAVVPEMVDQLCTALTGSADSAAIILAGRGRAFSSGNDLKEPPAYSDGEGHRRVLESLQEVTRRIRQFPGPVIAAVHGHALGAGCEFALAADFVIAADDATFGFPEISVGFGVTGGISYLLPRLVGLARARELILLGEWIPAQRALEIGLIHQVVSADALSETATALAEKLISQPREAWRRAKRTLEGGGSSGLEHAFETEIIEALAAGNGYQGTRA
jgi:2-(1,2-epoxy-1,2-dihydrophenyl)acetyl-CoA isomerase